MGIMDNRIMTVCFNIGIKYKWYYYTNINENQSLPLSVSV